MIIDKAVRDNPNFDFHWRCNKTATTHLCFADDLLIFCGGRLSSANTLKEALDLFFTLSGLQPNNIKSSIFIAGRDEHYKVQILQIFGFPEDSLLVRYLGVPLISNKLFANDCKILVENMVGRLRSWTCQFLSYARRLQLIKSVLFSL